MSSKKMQALLFCAAAVGAAGLAYWMTRPGFHPEARQSRPEASPAPSTTREVASAPQTPASSPAPSPAIPENSFDDSSGKMHKAVEARSQQDRTPSAAPQRADLSESLILQSSPWKIWSGAHVGTDGENVARISNIDVAAGDGASNLQEFDKQAPVIVFDERLGQTGILTGVIKIKSSQREALERSLNTFDAHIVRAFESIHTYFVTGNANPFNLEKLYTDLKSLEGINNVEPEILSRSYEKK